MYLTRKVPCKLQLSLTQKLTELSFMIINKKNILDKINEICSVFDEIYPESYHPLRAELRKSAQENITNFDDISYVISKYNKQFDKDMIKEKLNNYYNLIKLDEYNQVLSKNIEELVDYLVDPPHRIPMNFLNL